MTSFVSTFIWPQKLGRLFLFIDLCTAQYFVFSKLFHSFSGQGHTFQFKLFLTSFIDQPYTKKIIIKLINIGSYVNIGNVGSHYYYFRPESQTSRLQTRPSLGPTNPWLHFSLQESASLSALSTVHSKGRRLCWYGPVGDAENSAKAKAGISKNCIMTGFIIDVHGCSTKQPGKVHTIALLYLWIDIHLILLLLGFALNKFFVYTYI